MENLDCYPVSLKGESAEAVEVMSHEFMIDFAISNVCRLSGKTVLTIRFQLCMFYAQI